MSAFSEIRRAEVARRAGHRCEYCHLPTRGQVATFPIDHILPKSAGGSNELHNLALTCPHCNAHKGTDTSATDPDTGETGPFFDARRDTWGDHFEWSRESGELIGRTAMGRATVAGLKINAPTMIALRKLLAEVGLFPELTND